MADYVVKISHPKMRDKAVAGKTREQLIKELKKELDIKDDSVFFDDGFGFDVINPDNINENILKKKIEKIILQNWFRGLA